MGLSLSEVVNGVCWTEDKIPYYTPRDFIYKNLAEYLSTTTVLCIDEEIARLEKFEQVMDTFDRKIIEDHIIKCCGGFTKINFWDDPQAKISGDHYYDGVYYNYFSNTILFKDHCGFWRIEITLKDIIHLLKESKALFAAMLPFI